MAALSFPITGVLLDTTRETGEFIPEGETQPRTWDFTVLHVLPAGAREVAKVRLPKGVHVHKFEQGKTITVQVEVPPRTKLTTTLESIGLGDSAPERRSA